MQLGMEHCIIVFSVYVICFVSLTSFLFIEIATCLTGVTFMYVGVGDLQIGFQCVDILLY